MMDVYHDVIHPVPVPVPVPAQQVVSAQSQSQVNIIQFISGDY